MSTAVIERESKADPKSKNILIVDDEKITCDFFEVLLSKEGFKVESVNSGIDALRRLKSKNGGKIDLVIMDLMMPGPGGYEVLKELQNPHYQHVPVLVATSRNLDSFATDMIRLESNVCGVWKKPIEQAKFRRNVHILLGTKPKD